MRQSLADIEALAAAALSRNGHGTAAAGSCSWLEGAGYPGLKLLSEALTDTEQHTEPVEDALGLDLQNVSCVFTATQVEARVAARGRLFLRNVRHGLYLLPASVMRNYGIGCPVDPGFALGGERTKNPYAEKLAIAERNGADVDDALWHKLQNGEP